MVINKLPREFKVRVSIKDEKFGFPMHKRKHAVRVLLLHVHIYKGTILAHGIKHSIDSAR